MIRKDFVSKARRGFRLSKDIAHRTRVPRRKIVVHNDLVQEGVIGLWFLGLMPKDIANFIGQMTELEVMAVLRRYFNQHQDELMNQLIQTLSNPHNS
jgi:hypothetical protein